MPKLVRVLIALPLLLALASTIVPAADRATPDPETTYALFIGNSYCDFYVIPDQAEAMYKHAGQPADFRRETKGGFSLAKHWSAGRAQERISQDVDWDFVVLQNHSRSSLDHRELFDEYGAKFIDYIHANSDAEVVLYLTWARKKLPQDQAAITEAYCRLAVEHGAKVAPVGVAFEQWIKKHPDIDILRDDKASHPQETGAYLSACVFYATLTGKSPVGQTSKIAGYNWLTKGDTLVDLDAKTARMIQEHAWEVVQNFDPKQYTDAKAEQAEPAAAR